MRDIDQALAVSLPIPAAEKHMTSKRKFQGIPGIEVTPSGKLYATWYGGGPDEGPENYAVLAESVDNGASWKETYVIDPPGHVRAYDPTLWIDPKGRLCWFWAQCYSRQTTNIFDGRGGVWVCVADNPENPVWQTPRRIANGVMMNKPIVLSNGEWAYPTALWESQCGIEVLKEIENERSSGFTVSSDEGRTYAYRGGAQVPFVCYDEHMCVELKDGRIWMLVRAKYGIGQSYSADMGRTWTPGMGAPLRGPCSRFFIRRLKSGRILMVNHDPDPMNPCCRNRLMAKLSEDEGTTWIGGLMIDERPGVSYPDGTQAVDGSIWIIYDHERYRGGNIHLAHFSEEDVLAGKLQSKGASLRGIVSRYPYPS